MIDWPAPLSDATASDCRDARLAALTPGERFLKAVALSAYVRSLAWQGAQLHAQSGERAVIVDRFLLQVYGSEVVRQVRERQAATVVP